MKKKLLLIIFSVVFLTSCSKSENIVKKELYAMDTVMTLEARGANAGKAIDEAARVIYDFDNKFSVTYDGSEIYNINRNGSGYVSVDTLRLINTARNYGKMTGGAFDITTLVLSEAWGFTDKNYKVPEEDEISRLLSFVDYEKINVGDKFISLGENQKIGLGAIAKGYTSDKVLDVLEKNGVESAVISLGGNVATLGAKSDGYYKVAIQDPLLPDGVLGVVDAAAQRTSIITSGGYQRNFEENGVTYCHIIDPETGYPANSGLISVTVVSESGTKGDALSTAFYVMGLEKSKRYLEKNSGAEAVFVTENKEVYITKGLKGHFEEKGADNGYTYLYMD